MKIHKIWIWNIINYMYHQICARTLKRFESKNQWKYLYIFLLLHFFLGRNVTLHRKKTSWGGMIPIPALNVDLMCVSLYVLLWVRIKIYSISLFALQLNHIYCCSNQSYHQNKCDNYIKYYYKIITLFDWLQQS